MFGDWAQETTTTTGTGTLTLSSVSGKPRIADVFATNDLISYAILDSNGDPIESGIGVVAASNTLARIKVLATYVSGTFDNTAPAAATLAAGTKTVIATPVTGTFAAALPQVDTSATLRIIKSAHTSTTNANANSMSTSNRCKYVPFLLQAAVPINAFVINVTTAGATSIRCGLYQIDVSTGRPGTLIQESGDIDVSTTGTKTDTFTSRVLSPGWYYTAIAVHTVTVAVRGYLISPQIHPTPAGYIDFDTPVGSFYETLGNPWTTLPATASITGTLSQISEYPPIVALQVG